MWYACSMSYQIAVRIPDDAAAALDHAIQRGYFPNRASAIREALKLLLDGCREAEIAEQYRRGYATHPQEPWVGEAGLQAGAGLIAAESGSGSPG